MSEDGLCHICRRDPVQVDPAYSRTTCVDCEPPARDDTTWLERLRWKLTVRFMRWAVDTAPKGTARDLLHTLHLAWIDECKRQWAMRQTGSTRTS